MDLGNLPIIGAGASILVPVLLIGFGLVNCLFGYRLFKLMLALWGFLLGVIVGATIANNLAEGQTLWLVVGAVVGGLLGAVLLRSLYMFGVFVVGGIAGALLANAGGGVLGMETPLVVIIVFAIVGGIAAAILQRVAIILATAILGAWAIVRGISLLLTGSDPLPAGVASMTASPQEIGLPLLVILILLAILGIVGIVIQFRTTDEDEKD